MPTVDQILTFVDRYVPNTETDANKILDLDRLHKEVFLKLSRLKHDYEMYETTSIANQLTYTLPTNCSVDNIITVKVAQSTTISESTEWNTHDFAALLDNVDAGNYYGHVPSGLISLVSDGGPLQTGGLSIRIFYYKNPPSITATTDTPLLDESYHNLLISGLCQIIASIGNNPDTEVADYWQRKYDEFFQTVSMNLSSRFNSSPPRNNQVEEWW